jgi:hypothetical protein
VRWRDPASAAIPCRSVPDRPANPDGPAALPSADKPPLFRHPGRVAIGGGTLFAIVVLIAIAVGSADTSSLQTSQPQPKEVEGFSPQQGALVPPTTSISVDLRDDLIGEFTVCAPTPSQCTPIPLDQTEVVLGLGQVTFKPGEKITAKVHPLRDGRPGGNYVTIVAADGKIYD